MLYAVAEDSTYVVDSLSWVLPRAILSSSLATDDEGNEEMDAYVSGIMWDDWNGSPDSEPVGLKVQEANVMSLQVSSHKCSMRITQPSSQSSAILC